MLDTNVDIFCRPIFTLHRRFEVKNYLISILRRPGKPKSMILPAYHAWRPVHYMFHNFFIGVKPLYYNARGRFQTPCMVEGRTDISDISWFKVTSSKCPKFRNFWMFGLTGTLVMDHTQVLWPEDHTVGTPGSIRFERPTLKSTFVTRFL